MLVLNRKNLESIRIGDNIRLTIVEISGNKVRIGIEAPWDVSVSRDELSDRINIKDLRSQRDEKSGKEKE